MKRITAAVLTSVILLVAPASAQFVVEKPELPKGYESWPVTLTASCQTKTAQVKLSAWVRSEDSGMPVSRNISKSPRGVVRVDINGKTELFMHLWMVDESGPEVDAYFLQGKTWLKLFLNKGSARVQQEKLEALLKELFVKMGVAVKDAPMMHTEKDAMELLIMQCLEGPASASVEKPASGQKTEMDWR